MTSVIKFGGTVAKKAAAVAKASITIVGFVAATASAGAYHQTRKFLKEESRSKKQVLVLPFHRIKLVHGTDKFRQLRSKESEVEEIDSDEFVSIIEEAAKDKSICCIFGEFGHGRLFSGGNADAEEIRNALRVFRESHRSHPDPNISYEQKVIGDKTVRPLYAYADTFESASRPENPDYYIASVFTHIHIQRQGVVNLFGHSASVPFFRKFLENHGVKVHAYKHGAFKNSPNSLTESGFTKHHKRNVEGYLWALNRYTCDAIECYRKGVLLNGDMWKLIQNSGSFTATAAEKMGFIDHVTDLNPLDALLEHRKAVRNGLNAKSQNIKETWTGRTDLDAFPADESITLSKYREIVAKRKKLAKTRWHIYERIKKAAEKYLVFRRGLSLLGYNEPLFNLSTHELSHDKALSASEKIALVKINGTIDQRKVNKLLPVLTKIREDKDVRAVVAMINSPGGTLSASDHLLQEFRGLKKKTVFSFGNVAASGGYYIASSADRIFSSQGTLTGSIGVYGIRFDLSEAAARYGINFGHVSTGDLGLYNNVFAPVTKQFHAVHWRSVDRGYMRFKEVVAEGRDLDKEYLENLAEGRIWTGEQAHHNGLVDEIGGLNRAIAFARRNYTSGAAEVVHYYEEETIFERFNKLLARTQKLLFRHDDIPRAVEIEQLPLPQNVLFPCIVPNKAFGVFLTLDENAAIRLLLESGND